MKSEIFDVIERPKIKNILKANKARDLKIILIHKTKTIKPSMEVDGCRDPKDNFLLSLCHECDADCLITGDNDLLVLKAFRKTKIINLTEFIEAYKQYL